MLAVQIIPQRASSLLRNLVSALGLIFILVSVFYFTDDTDFPGVNALLPSLGAALIIFSGISGESFVGKALSLAPVVFIGAISYSLYLWHWPLLVFMKYYLIIEPTPLQWLAWLSLTFVLSILSWKFVENPFRKGGFLKRTTIFALAGSVMAVFVASSLLIDKIPRSFEPEKTVNKKNDSEWKHWERCMGNPSNPCSIGDETQEPVFFVWGDSHAKSMAPAIDGEAKLLGVGGLISSLPTCRPLLDVVNLPNCLDYNDSIIQYISEHPSLTTVILVARWSAVPRGMQKKIDAFNKENNKNFVYAELVEMGLSYTVEKLHSLNRKIVIVLPVPDLNYDAPSALSIALRTGRDVNKIITPTFSEYEDVNRSSINTINLLMEEGKIDYIINPIEALCDENRCKAALNEQPLYYDQTHLSPFGAHYIEYLFEPVFENIR